MQELLALYEEIIKAATDDKIATHIANLVTDAQDLAAATKAVIEQARARAAQ
jgi:hypothetical protein